MTTSCRLIFGAVALALVAIPASGRDRPKRPVDYYTFSEKVLEERIAPFREEWDRVTLRSELQTRVTRGALLCRIEWAGRRVDYVEGSEGDSVRFGVPLPRGAKLSELVLYRIANDGKDAERVKEPRTTIREDSLLVGTTRGSNAVFDLQFKLAGEGISVSERFPFTLEIPVVEAVYRFSVSRDLLQRAADRGLSWDFAATTRPRVWPPTKADDPEYFTWYWRVDASKPLVPDAPGDDAWVSVTGFLPDPALAGIDPDQLPEVESLAEVAQFERRLIEQIQTEDRATPSGSSGSGGRGGATSVEVPTGGKR